MSEVLSQAEIDELLEAVSTGNVDTTAGFRAVGDWVAYDLTSNEKVIRGRFAALEGIHGRFTRYFRTTLTDLFHKTVKVSVSNLEYMRFSDLANNLLPPVSLNIYAMGELPGYMMLVCGGKLAYALLDSYFGGPERPYARPGARNEFTKIENRIISKIGEYAIKDLEKAWANNFSMKFKHLRTESSPAFVGVIQATDLVAVVGLDIEFEALSGPLYIVIQLKAFDTMKDLLKADVREDNTNDEERWHAHWLRELMDIPLDISVELGTTKSSLRAIREWKVGDVVQTEQDTVSVLPVCVSGFLKAKGSMGVFRGSRAVRITDLVEPKPNTEPAQK